MSDPQSRFSLKAYVRIPETLAAIILLCVMSFNMQTDNGSCMGLNGDGNNVTGNSMLTVTLSIKSGS